MRFDKETFINRDIRLENNEYHNCKFERCLIAYNASGPVVLVNNSFNDCEWKFDGAAAATVNFMASIYPLAKNLIEATFDNIRRGGLKP